MRTIVATIESSNLLENDKYHLYRRISRALGETVTPILLKFMPKEKLLALANAPDTLTVDGYVDVFRDAVKDGDALKEMDIEMHKVLIEVQLAFQEGDNEDVIKKIENRFAILKERMLSNETVAHQYVVAWNTLKAATVNGSFREQVVEKLSPGIQAGMTAEKWTMKIAGFICRTALGIGSGTVVNETEEPEKMNVKFMGKIGELLNKKVTDRRIDAVVSTMIG